MSRIIKVVMQDSDPKHTSDADQADRLPVSAKRVLRSEDLLGEDAAVWIQHDQVLYRLMKTRQGKLILTK